MPFKTNYCLFTQSTGQQQPIVDEQICFLAEQIDQLFTTGWTSANLKPTAEQQTILNLVEPLTTDHTDVVIRVKDILTTTPNSLKAIYALYDVAYWDNYQAWINWIIRAHNVTNLIAIWSLIYHHDRANPDFDSDILVACDYADLKTFVYVFYGFHCFARVNQSESNFDVADLKWQMKDNPHKAEIEAFLQKMIDGQRGRLHLPQLHHHSDMARRHHVDREHDVRKRQ